MGGNALERLAAVAPRGWQDVPLVRVGGTVVAVAPTHVRVSGLARQVRLGDLVTIEAEGGNWLSGEVIRIDADAVHVRSFDRQPGIGIGAAAFRVGPFRLAPHPSWAGRIINALAEPIDGAGALPHGPRCVPVHAQPPHPLARAPVTRAVSTGVRAIDLFTPMCEGQRIGIFAGSGIGKSTLLAMIAAAPAFDLVVLALVGERGREVRGYLEGPLKAQRQRALVVVATGDESPMLRRLAPLTAMAVAESFRDEGRRVLLIIDSVTRYAHAAREIALSAGEPPVARGYAPSVFADLPQLLERAGPGEVGSGSITGVFSVLVDGDDHNDPVADAVRGTLDGHIVLSRAIAEQGRQPAIDILTSVSRVADSVHSKEQAELIRLLRGLIARFEDTRDLRLLGGYQPGTGAELDRAVALVPMIYDALRQAPGEATGGDPFAELSALLRTG